MAIRLNKETIESARRSRYKWDEWLDGKVWEGQEGTDYTCKQSSFVSQLYKAAYDRGKRVHVSPKEHSVEWEAYDPEDEDLSGAVALQDLNCHLRFNCCLN